jgi:hypothetical protein
VQDNWLSTADSVNAAKTLSTKFKKLIVDLRKWSHNMSNLKLLIENWNIVIGYLDSLEGTRLLYNPERNLRRLVKTQLQKLLHYKNLYWKKGTHSIELGLGMNAQKFLIVWR